MSSPLPVTRRSAESRPSVSAKPVASVPQQMPAQTAAEHDAGPSGFSDPLWGMAIASIILLALLAGLIASS